jgi:RhoGAP domain
MELPPILKQSIEYILPRAREKGLFRVSGVATEIRALRKRFRQGKRVDLKKEVTNVHTVCGLLKSYFHDMERPLMTVELYDCFIAAVNVPDDQMRLLCLRKVVNLLPDFNFFVLAGLFEFLYFVSLNAATNQMTPRNLGIVFAPSLLRPLEAELEHNSGYASPSDALALVADQSHTVAVVESLIDNFRSIFTLRVSDIDASAGDAGAPTLERAKTIAAGMHHASSRNNSPSPTAQMAATGGAADGRKANTLAALPPARAKSPPPQQQHMSVARVVAALPRGQRPTTPSRPQRALSPQRAMSPPRPQRAMSPQRPPRAMSPPPPATKARAGSRLAAPRAQPSPQAASSSAVPASALQQHIEKFNRQLQRGSVLIAGSEPDRYALQEMDAPAPPAKPARFRSPPAVVASSPALPASSTSAASSSPSPPAAAAPVVVSVAHQPPDKPARPADDWNRPLSSYSQAELARLADEYERLGYRAPPAASLPNAESDPSWRQRSQGMSPPSVLGNFHFWEVDNPEIIRLRKMVRQKELKVNTAKALERKLRQRPNPSEAASRTELRPKLQDAAQRQQAATNLSDFLQQRPLPPTPQQRRSLPNRDTSPPPMQIESTWGQVLESVAIAPSSSSSPSPPPPAATSAASGRPLPTPKSARGVAIRASGRGRGVRLPVFNNHAQYNNSTE